MDDRSGQVPEEADARYRLIVKLAIEVTMQFFASHADAEDIAHETWIAVERALEKVEYSQIRRFDSWVRRIAINKAINRYKNKWSRVLRESRPVDDVHLLGSERSPELNAELREYEVQLAEALLSLEAPFKQSFALYYRGHSYDEIAAIQGCPVGTVKGRVFRAKEKLASIIERAPSSLKSALAAIEEIDEEGEE